MARKKSHLISRNIADSARFDFAFPQLITGLLAKITSFSEKSRKSGRGAPKFDRNKHPDVEKNGGSCGNDGRRKNCRGQSVS